MLFRLQTDYAFPGKSPLRETRAFRLRRARTSSSLFSQSYFVWGFRWRIGGVPAVWGRRFSRREKIGASRKFTPLLSGTLVKY